MNNHFAYKADIKKLEKQISSNKNFKFNIKDKNNLFPASNNFSTDNNSEHIYKIINTSLKLFSNKCYSECSDLCLSLLKIENLFYSSFTSYLISRKAKARKGTVEHAACKPNY